MLIFWQPTHPESQWNLNHHKRAIPSPMKVKKHVETDAPRSPAESPATKCLFNHKMSVEILQIIA